MRHMHHGPRGSGAMVPYEDTPVPKARGDRSGEATMTHGNDRKGLATAWVLALILIWAAPATRC